MGNRFTKDTGEVQCMARMLVFAGPNGSGKSKITSELQTVGEYVNADMIAKNLGCDNLHAAKMAEETREYLLAHNMDFTFETVLSTPRNLDLMRRAKRQGYYVICIYVLTCSPEINVRRVEQRAKGGGHDVPPETIRKRYRRALGLFPQLLLICDELYVYDNTPERDEGFPSMIVSLRSGELTAYPSNVWDASMIESLLMGRYQGE